jgi:SAM-dependent methyltransferase
MSADWWGAAFSADYLAVYAHRDDGEAAVVADRILARVPPGSLLLDVGCGAGRHLARLRAAGLQAVGFDYSSDLLHAARQRCGIAGRLARADMRRPPVAVGSCDTVVLLFTVFGYFDETGNRDCLRALASLLKPGGLLLLDLPDAVGVRRDLVPASSRRLADGSQVEERRSWQDGRVVKDVCMTAADGRQRNWQESVRLYEPDELVAVAADAGLRPAGSEPGVGSRTLWWFSV